MARRETASTPRYSRTDVGGAYNVTLLASFADPSRPQEVIKLSWLGAFWIEPLGENNEAVRDGMPDTWEARHGLNIATNDSTGDADHDGLTNLRNFKSGPCPLTQTRTMVAGRMAQRYPTVRIRSGRMMTT